LQKRDEEDWPVLATALALECSIWVELLLREAQQPEPAQIVKVRPGEAGRTGSAAG
jgi:hypothetical protein